MIEHITHKAVVHLGQDTVVIVACEPAEGIPHYTVGFIGCNGMDSYIAKYGAAAKIIDLKEIDEDVLILALHTKRVATTLIDVITKLRDKMPEDVVDTSAP